MIVLILDLDLDLDLVFWVGGLITLVGWPYVAYST